jgi:predicted deacylase
VSDALAPYPSPEARLAETRAKAQAAGAAVESFGESVEGRPLHVVKVAGARPGLPRVLCCANIHGPEFVGSRVAMGVLEALGDARAEGLRERAEVWVVPCLNPDGYARTWEAGGVGSVATLRTNANGVDLNRNFPLPAGEVGSRLPFAGSRRRGAATYRGTQPLSEPETQALKRLCDAADFHASANLHSFMGTLICPRVRQRDHFDTYLQLGAEFQAAQQTRYRRLGSFRFDVFTGEQEDHQHHAHRTWAVCVEVFPVAASYRQHLRSPSTFWRFNPHNPRPWVDNDVPGVLAWFQAALDRPRPT